MKAIIVEDEPSSILYLSNFLSKHFPKILVQASVDNVDDAVIRINELMPDILFLDINLKGGNSFDILDQIDYKSKFIIFITAYDNYAIKAFRYSSVDYILKPFEDHELITAINKIDFSLDKQINYKSLLNNVQGGLNNFLIIKAVDGFSSVDKDTIIRIESSSNYSTIFLLDETKIVSAKTLGYYSQLLADSGFYRIHNSHLINLKHFKSYKTKGGGCVILTNGETLPISQRRKHEFLEFVAQANKIE